MICCSSVKTGADEESSTVDLARRNRGLCAAPDSSSLWYVIGAISALDYKERVSNALPIPFVPELLSAALGLVFMTSGMAALWWLVLKHERWSLRQIALPWWIGLIGGTSIAVYWLARLSASNGENDEFVFVPPLIFVIGFEVILLVRMSFNAARTPLRSSTSDSSEN
jgi:NhaP-type Na+/H+ or K+/H+ antiporter